MGDLDMERETEKQKVWRALRPGKAVRRENLLAISPSVDRCLKELVAEAKVRKLSQGLYMRPKETAFGPAAADETMLLRSFLKTDHFFVFNPSVFNSLGLGTTQLYNKRIVINPKRHGELSIAGRNFSFQRRDSAKVPKEASPEVLVVEMLNGLSELAEDEKQIMSSLERKLTEFDSKQLARAVQKYGSHSTHLKYLRLTEASEANCA
ncbi:MAG: hypothetical protein IPJ88_18075 [Myxococcales bacterium]|nr:MAG: hypothetical protein IPJ88_18075 [Myxococcales bacterium]